MSSTTENVATKDSDGELTRHCGRCGRSAMVDGGEALLTWTHEKTPRGPGWICPACTRRNLHAIEGGLDDVAFWD